MTDWSGVLEHYSITFRQLQEVRRQLIIAQKFRCASCGKDCSGRAMDLDHDHKTGRIRGMLCHGPFSCNARLGVMTKDDLLNLLAYVQRAEREPIEVARYV